MFSSEKMIHSMIRNRLDPQLVAAIMTIRWTYEALQQFGGKTVQTDNCDDDIEFVEYDEYSTYQKNSTVLTRDTKRKR